MILTAELRLLERERKSDQYIIYILDINARLMRLFLVCSKHEIYVWVKNI
jgi:hypothetical protein